ncbi:endonuclease domain-containing protein [Paraburkholderia bannensis]|uniref:endonuclease domain-containing protein n=1 Tax=Paraburkholderia bannensis TaxID=765414 RepID=UPI002AB66A88|nr:endonuclease domain-containing protein [Paraburkholderia bannensis]
MTEAERLLWRHLRAHRLCGEKFRRQHPIGPYIVDFMHCGARVVIEADGGHHNGSASDATRDAWFRSRGFTVLRFWNNEVLQNIDGVLEAILGAVNGATTRPSPPAPLPSGRGGGKHFGIFYEPSATNQDCRHLHARRHQ